MSTSTETANKAVVLRFNRECIEAGNMAVLPEILAPDFVNRTAMPGLDPGIEGIRYVFEDVLHRGLSDLTVIIENMIAEGDFVATRKRFEGRHTGDFLGAPATGRDVEIIVHDLVRLRDGLYVEHWGQNTIPLVAQALSQPD